MNDGQLGVRAKAAVHLSLQLGQVVARSQLQRFVSGALIPYSAPATALALVKAAYESSAHLQTV